MQASPPVSCMHCVCTVYASVHVCTLQHVLQCTTICPFVRGIVQKVTSKHCFTHFSQPTSVFKRLHQHCLSADGANIVDLVKGLYDICTQRARMSVGYVDVASLPCVAPGSKHHSTHNPDCFLMHPDTAHAQHSTQKVTQGSMTHTE